VTGVLAALQTCGALRKDLWAKTLVQDAAVFHCGLIELFKGRPRVAHTANQFLCVEVQRLSVSKKTQGVRIVAVLFTVVLVVFAQYAVFLAARMTRIIRRISDGVEFIIFEGRDGLARADQRADCVKIDKRSATQNSLSQYVYESCIENTVWIKGSLRLVNRELFFNFSTNEDGFPDIRSGKSRKNYFGNGSHGFCHYIR
jgi:hypothetical protein